MDLFFIVICVVVAALVVLAFFVKKSSQAAKEISPYVQKQYFMTNAEKDFFLLLGQIIGDRYYIFSQVSVNSLLTVDRQGKDFIHYLNKMRQKSVDFVLVEKNTMRTLLIIELDDRSHLKPERMARDQFLDETFAAADLKLLRVQNQRHYDFDALRYQINAALAQ